MSLWTQMQKAEAKRALANSLVQSKQPKLAKATEPAKKAAEKPRRGPKPSGSAKVLISLRLDPEVISGFKNAGPGWQGRMNAVLRSYLGL